MKQIAAYVRVSTDEQAGKGNSLTEQQERLAAYCKAMGWPEPAFYIDDGYSAKNLNRPAIKRLLDDVCSRKVDIVLTTKLDRLCRNLLDLLQTVELFSAHGCSYTSASESFDTSTAVGRMTLQLLGTFAEFERERISERVKDNMLSLAKNTSLVITQPCFGYDIIDGRYAINESEAIFVRMMFDLAEQGHGHRMIAKVLNDHGSTTKRGKMWEQVSVKRLMRNETLAGVMVYNRRETRGGKIVERDKAEWVIKENNHPAIIPPERFDRVQGIIRSRMRQRKHADSETYLLTGLVMCKYCGKAMRGNTARQKTPHGEYTYFRYTCSSYSNGRGCKYHAVHRDDLEQVIIKQIKSLAASSNKTLELKVAASSSVEDEIKSIRDQIARANKRMQRQIEAYEHELISASDLADARQRIDAEREHLDEQLKRLEGKLAQPETDALKASAAHLLPDVTSIDRLKAKAAIRRLIDHIEVEGEHISIVWKV